MRIVKKILKIMGFTLGGLILLVGLVLLFIQTPIGKRQIAKIAENQVNKIINASISIGKIKGNFFTHLELDDLLLLSKDGETVAHIPAIRLAYQLKPLLNNEIHVNKIEIDNPYIFLEQYSDSSWNFAHLVLPTPDDTTSSAFNMLVVLESLVLDNGKIVVNALDSIIPSRVEELRLVVSGMYNTEKYGGEIAEFHFKTYDPDVVLNRLALKVNGTEKMIALPFLTLETAKNRVNINGEYHFNLQDRSFVNLQSDSIFLDEFAWILPDISTKAVPQLSLFAEIIQHELNGKIELMEKRNGLSLQFSSNNLLDALLGESIVIPDYDLSLRANNVELAHWLDDSTLNYIFNADMSAAGEGITPQTINAKLALHIFDSHLLDYQFRGVDLLAHYDKGDVDASLHGMGAFGEITLLPQVQDLLGEQPRYQIYAETRHLNPAVFLNDENFQGDVNLDLHASGVGFNYKTLNANADLRLYASQFYRIAIDTAHVNVDYEKQDLLINDLFFNALDAQIRAAGNYNLIAQSDLEIDASIDNLDKIKTFLAIPALNDLHSSLRLNGHLSGTPENMTALIDFKTGYTQFETYHLDSLLASASATLKGDSIGVDGTVLARNIFAADFTFDTLSVDLSTDLTNYSVQLDLYGKEIDLNLQADASLRDTISALIHELGLAYHDYVWTKCDSLSSIEITPSSYAIRNFALHNEKEKRQLIALDGVIRQDGEQDFKAMIHHLNIDEILKLLDIKEAITGELNLDLTMTGEATDPEINGMIYVKNAGFESYRLDSLTGKVNYADRTAQAFLSLVPQDSGKVYIAAKMPALIELDSMRFDLTPHDEDSISADIFIADLPLSMAKMFLPDAILDGFINSHIDVSGTFGAPEVNGFLKIPKGHIKIEDYGVNYQNIVANINIEQDKINIDTFHIESYDKSLLSKHLGAMNAKGEATFNNSLFSGELVNANIDIHFNKFKPINHRQYNTELDGNIRLLSDRDSVYFTGDITIPETEVYLPAVMNLLGKNSAPAISKPLLVQEMERSNADSSALLLTENMEQEEEQDTAKYALDYAFMDNLRGNVKVRIPRNTWIKNDEMRIELSGDVDLIKHQDFFEIFGNIDILRGQYSLMNKVFIIKNGTITFQGGEKFNPLLSLEATYTFRDPERNKKDLLLTISGDLDKPELAFKLDDAAISEGDAISYIIFGMSMDALTSNQHQAVSDGVNAAGLAQSAAASLVSSELTQIFGNLLNVDYIELKSNGSFTDMSLNVGKYITNNIFVSYEQHIGNNTDEQESGPNTIFRLEYEILKFLFLELTVSPNLTDSGGDLIFKFNSK